MIVDVGPVDVCGTCNNDSLLVGAIVPRSGCPQTMPSQNWQLPRGTICGETGKTSNLKNRRRRQQRQRTAIIGVLPVFGAHATPVASLLSSDRRNLFLKKIMKLMLFILKRVNRI